MKKKFAFLMALVVGLTSFSAMAADFSVKDSSFKAKKASSVKTQEKSGLESITSGSLLPGVIGMVSNVAALTKQQKELAAECVPSSSEISWVNDMVKEYAKVGEETAGEMLNRLKMTRCGPNEHYSKSVEVSRPANLEPCTDVFEDKDTIWNGYPMAAVASYCADGMEVCSGSKKKTESNVYAIFGAISFTVDDYATDEADKYTKMMAKIEKCAPEKISARSKQAYADFLKTTISTAGGSASSGAVWDAVGGLTSGGGLSGVQSLMPAVTQFLDK